MDEKSRIQAATILQGIVKGYMNPVRHMSADDEKPKTGESGGLAAMLNCQKST